MENEKGRSIVEKIKKEHIVPESRWKLNFKSYVFWAVVFAMLVLGGLSFSLIIFNFLDFAPGVFRHFGLGKIIRTFVFTAPYLWIAFFLLALFSGFLAFRKTKRGYRYGVFFAGSLGVLFVSLLGVTLHLTSVHEKLERGISGEFPGRRHLIFPIEGRWSSPEEKMLGGEITEVFPGRLMLITFRDETWEVYYSPATEIRTRREFAPGMDVGVIGEKIGERKFQAELIRSLPFRRPGRPCSGSCGKASGLPASE